ncbi:MAG: YncE family protein [Frankiales bacterium]|nr:YncE family protein [Frankiales bacterium]
MRLLIPVSLAAALLLSGCQGGGTVAAPVAVRPSAAPVSPPVTPPVTPSVPARFTGDLYAADRPGMLAPEARLAKPLVYVPDDRGNRVVVIDPATYKVLREEPVGRLPQHVTPSWDLKTLWVDNDMGNSLTPIDPRTGAFGAPVKVADPYNLYFTIDGRSAVVVAERLRRLDFRDPHTMALQQTLHVPCQGVDHADFSIDGSHALFSCEFGGQLLWVDMVHRRVDRVIDLPRETGRRPKPQDVKISPDGRTFYVADENSNGVYELDALSLKLKRFVTTGLGAHGLYVSRDSKDLYVTNRHSGSVAVMSFATGQIRRFFAIPGGTPDMGGVSADGRVLWLSGRYTGEVYAIDTVTGKLLARIKVGGEPHGLCVWPQPGRFSLGHTGVLR